MIPTTSHDILTNRIKIHYERTGGAKPPFLLCHGITDNGRCMLRLAEHLAPRFDVIMIDARGHGLSDSPDEGYTADHHADDLYGLIIGLKLVNPIIYGHSMGARTTVRLARKYPRLPRAIVLEDPVSIISPNEEERAARDLWLKEFTREILYRKSLCHTKLLQIAKDQNHPDWTGAEEAEWAIAKTQVSEKVVNISRSMDSILDDFPHITCPTLVLKADADEKIRRKNEASVAQIPLGKIIHVPRAGHNVRRDNWSDTIQYLDSFLENLSIIP
jgi:pimeloyl-ACP methyl ester carboxylesterase